MVFQRTYIILLQVDHLQDKMSSVDVFAGMADPAVDPPGEVVKYTSFLEVCTNCTERNHQNRPSLDDVSPVVSCLILPFDMVFSLVQVTVLWEK